MKKFRLILTTLAIILASSFQSQAQVQCDSSNYQADTCDNVFVDMPIIVADANRSAGGGDIYYMHSSAGEHPWSQTTNTDSMDAVFGAANWTQGFFETADPATLFSVDTEFIYMDGSDDSADALNTFVTASGAAMEAWVNAGGKLFFNAASQSPDVPMFGDIVLTYVNGDPGIGSVDAALPSHPAFAGPLPISSTTYTGNNFAHNQVDGSGLTNILVETGGTRVALAEGAYGNGFILVGGMTTTNWHSPAPDAGNFRTNLLTYMQGIIILGTNDTAINGFSIAPNPSTTSFTIEGDFSIENVSLYNLLGQKVMEIDTNQVDISNLKTGTYLVTVTDIDGNQATKRMVKK